jgi:hypothetical protein
MSSLSVVITFADSNPENGYLASMPLEKFLENFEVESTTSYSWMPNMFKKAFSAVIPSNSNIRKFSIFIAKSQFLPILVAEVSGKGKKLSETRDYLCSKDEVAAALTVTGLTKSQADSLGEMMAKTFKN